MAKTRKQRLQALGVALKKLREPYEPEYRELGDNFQPRRTRFSEGRSHRNNVNKKMLSSKPARALRTLQNGMQQGITSPARPWFRLIPADRALKNNATIKAHTHSAEQAIRQMLQSSGCYNTLHTLWGDLGCLGTDCGIFEDEDRFGVVSQALVPGEYWLGVGAGNIVDTLYREVDFKVQYVVGKFVYGGNTYGTPNWNVVRPQVKKMWEEGQIDENVKVGHLIAPRMDREALSPLPRDMPIMSTYWDRDDTDDSRFLGDLGYRRNPLVGSRWDVEGTNVYGSGPAVMALPDARLLQLQERDKLEAVRRMNRPPMNAPMEMRNSPYSLAPEAVNFVQDPTRGMVPAYSVNPPIEQLRADIEETGYDIDEAMYANLFMMIANLDRRQITAREIDERHEEKLIQLGPVLERQHREKLGPLIRTLYQRGLETGRIEPLPEDFDGVPLEIDYISLLGQAMKAVATGGVERMYGFLGNVSAADITVLDNVDNDAAAREYADMIGIPPTIMRPEEEVARIRADRQQQLEQQAALENAERAAPVVKQAADAAKVVAETDATGRPVDILRNLGLA